MPRGTKNQEVRRWLRAHNGQVKQSGRAPRRGSAAEGKPLYARHRLHCKPRDVLFDAWYPSRQLLQQIRDYGWDFVSQLKKSRTFEGQP
jgi:hypothetical protein